LWWEAFSVPIPVTFIHQPPHLVFRAHDSAVLAEWTLQASRYGIAWVVDDAYRLIGAVRREAEGWDRARTVADMLIAVPAHLVLDTAMTAEAVQARLEDDPFWPLLPVVQDGRLVGEVHRNHLPKPVGDMAPDWAGLSPDALSAQLLNTMASGILLLDANGIIRLLNPYGAEWIGVTPEEVVGRPYVALAPYLFPHMRDYLTESAVPRAVRGLEDHGERSFRLPNGRHGLFRFGTVRHEGRVAAVIVTFMDITAQVNAEAEARQARDEVESAFSLLLPNTKVEAKLKSSPEYQDVYDPKTGTATVTEVLPDGTYWHVVNGLRLLAELKAIGVFQLVGIDKDTLVQAFLYHDLGKEQPRLAVGDRFVPQKTFEPGHKHAARSADWALRHYGVSTEVAWLIRCHHTPENALPAEFPEVLLPMLRILKVVDGLSAGITRRGARREPFRLEGSTLIVGERNVDARYQRRYALALYSGVETPLPWPEDDTTASRP
jgi:PAS domain S-box-containing protein